MTDRLDRAIDVAIDKTDLNYQGDIRKFSRALIADLLEGMEDGCIPQEYSVWNACLRAIRTRAGIGGE